MWRQLYKFYLPSPEMSPAESGAKAAEEIIQHSTNIINKANIISN